MGKFPELGIHSTGSVKKKARPSKFPLLKKGKEGGKRSLQAGFPDKKKLSKEGSQSN